VHNSLQKVNLLGEANSTLFKTLPEECLYLHILLVKYNEKDICNINKTGLFFQIKLKYTFGSNKISE
jgi:hypothetical protein